MPRDWLAHVSDNPVGSAAGDREDGRSCRNPLTRVMNHGTDPAADGRPKDDGLLQLPQLLLLIEGIGLNRLGQVLKNIGGDRPYVDDLLLPILNEFRQPRHLVSQSLKFGLV